MLPCVTCAKTDTTKRKLDNQLVKFVILVDSKKYKNMLVIILITHVLNVHKDVLHCRALLSAVLVVLEQDPPTRLGGMVRW